MDNDQQLVFRKPKPIIEFFIKLFVMLLLHAIVFVIAHKLWIQGIEFEGLSHVEPYKKSKALQYDSFLSQKFSYDYPNISKIELSIAEKTEGTIGEVLLSLSEVSNSENRLLRKSVFDLKTISTSGIGRFSFHPAVQAKSEEYNIVLTVPHLKRQEYIRLWLSSSEASFLHDYTWNGVSKKGAFSLKIYYQKNIKSVIHKILNSLTDRPFKMLQSSLLYIIFAITFFSFSIFLLSTIISFFFVNISNFKYF